MKKLDFSLILGCCIISLGIMMAGFIIANKLPQTPYVPSNLSVTTTDGTPVFHEYMSEYEAAAFLMVNTDDFTAFVQSGELDGTFTKIREGYVFSKEKLTQWIEKRIANE